MARRRISALDDTPKHLYGLDKDDTSSGDESVNSESETQNNLGQKRTCMLLSVVFICLASTVFILVVGLIVQRNLIHDKLVHKDKEIKVSQGPDSELDQSFKELQDKLEALSSQVNGLLAQETMSREDEQPEKSDPSISKEQLRNIVEGLVKEKMEAALDTYSADKLGIPDFALESAGGNIHESYHSVSFSRGAPQVLFFGIPLWYNVKSPRVIIQPDNTPGNCWAFEGQQGFVTIKLSRRIKPTAFTIEHIPTSLSSTGDGRIPSAPKEFSVWGWRDPQGKIQRCIGRYIYDSKGKPLQTFTVQEMTEATFQYVQLQIHSNYGNPKYTCIYRFRVHGQITVACAGSKTRDAEKKQP